MENAFKIKKNLQRTNEMTLADVISVSQMKSLSCSDVMNGKGEEFCFLVRSTAAAVVRPPFIVYLFAEDQREVIGRCCHSGRKQARRTCVEAFDVVLVVGARLSILAAGNRKKVPVFSILKQRRGWRPAVFRILALLCVGRSSVMARWEQGSRLLSLHPLSRNPHPTSSVL